jgi:hypothetical protein
MSTIINADNGVVSGVPGLKYVSDSTGNLQLQTNGTNALLLDTSQYPSATVNGLGTGRIPAEQFYRLDSTLVGLNSTAIQSILGVGVTLVSNTVYQFSAEFFLSKSAGTTSHTFSLGFGGTATVNNIAYSLISIAGAASTWNYVDTTLSGASANTASMTVVTGNSSVAGLFRTMEVKGTVSINTGGTFIPQYQLSPAPGGAYTAQIGNYFKISPLGASGSNTSIGTWS